MNANDVETFSINRHMKEKTMWIGYKHKTTVKNMAGALANGTVIPILSEHTPAALGCLNEILVNAVDHAVECRMKKTSRQVTYINMMYDESGTFTCRNDGPCIDIKQHDGFTRQDGRPVYIPEVVFCKPLSGTNMTKDQDSIKGGVNGLGGKLANMHSAVFVVRVQDGKYLYVLNCEQRMDVIHPAQLVQAQSADIYTEVSMYLDYACLDYGQLTTIVRDEIMNWLRLRAMQCAAYLGDSVKVYFNGQHMKVDNALALAQYYLPLYAPKTSNEALVLSTQLKSNEPRYKKFPWDIAVVVSPEIRSFKCVTIVNGVPTAAGVHIKKVKKMIAEEGTKEVHKLLEDRQVSVMDATANMFIIILAAIPGAEWSGQRKDELSYRDKNLESFTLPKEFLKRLAPVITQTIMIRLGKKEKKASNAKAKVKPDKYTRALRLGLNSTLCACEGDSAKGTMEDGFGYGKSKVGQPSVNNFGIISLRGVPINALRNVVTIDTAGGGKQTVRKQKLVDNKTFQSFEAAMGLRHDYTYTTQAEVNTLNYGRIVACVDQDLDGAGKILGLFITYLYTFWPALFQNGMVYWFMTPVIRVFPKGNEKDPVAEFYHESSYREWWDKVDIEQKKKYHTEYYKGLGSHDEPDVKRMFGNFESMCVRIVMDEHMPAMINTYFGEDAAGRKKILSTPAELVKSEHIQHILSVKSVPCSWVFSTYCKSYKLDALLRQIPNVVDGLNLAKRKSLYCAEKYFANRSDKVKTNTLAGYIICNGAYEHGEMSLNDTLQKMAQEFTGARLLPIFVGYGQFGSRKKGGSDAAQPRYVSMKLNKKLTKEMFPPADLPLLEYVEQEGEEVEPKYYVPILPFVLLDHGNNPSEGWRYASWGRDITGVAAAVKACVTSDFQPSDEGHNQWLRQHQLPLCNYGYSPQLSFGMRNGKMHSFGSYTYDQASMKFIITELPMRIWNESYIKSLEEDEFRSSVIKNIDDYSNSKEITIHVQITSAEALNTIYAKYEKADDPYREFLRLHASLQPFLNYINTDGSVKSLEGEDYHGVIAAWYPIRKEYYKHRLERERELELLHIEAEEEVLRFIPLASGFNFGKKKNRSAAEKILEENNFKKFNIGALRRPGKGRAGTIRQRVLSSTSDPYSYLLELRQGDMMTSEQEKRKAKLEARRTHVAEIQKYLEEKPFPGATTWCKEIDSLLAVVTKARTKGGWKDI